MKKGYWWTLGRDIPETLFCHQQKTKVEQNKLHAEDGRNLLEQNKEHNKVETVFKEDYLRFMALNRGLLKIILEKSLM